jgi:hypothetical protein
LVSLLHRNEATGGATMLLKIICYIIIISFIFIIPEKNWFNLIESFKEIKNKFFKNFKLNKGESLVFAITRLESRIHLNKLNEEILLPEYKFYTELIYNLVELSKTQGIKLKSYLADLKEVLKIDQKNQKKINHEIKNSYLQFISISLTTWLFIFISKQIIEINVSPYLLFAICLIQILGFISFMFFIKKIEHKIFHCYSNAIKELLIFQSLIEASIPITSAIKTSKIGNGEFMSHQKFNEFSGYFFQSLERLKTEGGSIREDCKTTLKLVFESEEDDLTNFKKKVALLKFMHLALIFLPAYFIYLFSIFSNFIEQ